jgi:hypothetical protein
MEPIKYTLTFERSTKRYHVYRDLSGAMMPDRLYVSQDEAGPTPPPTSIVVTVTTDAS